MASVGGPVDSFLDVIGQAPSIPVPESAKPLTAGYRDAAAGPAPQLARPSQPNPFRVRG